MDIDRLKRLLLLCLVIIGLVAADRTVRAAANELAAPLATAAVPVTSGEQREPRQRKLQFRARLLKHWWQPRTGMVAASRRPLITKII